MRHELTLGRVRKLGYEGHAMRHELTLGRVRKLGERGGLWTWLLGGNSAEGAAFHAWMPRFTSGGAAYGMT
ncbi:MAG: hypothetical protein U1E05_10780 [Patescibacteria group bacterium]|nr:hypothetical protein [Patescibacteria group bacterium]